MTTILGVAAATWGLIMALAPLLQVRRMRLRRSSKDVSIGYYSILLPGFALWVAYGVARGDWAIAVPNSVAFLVGLVTIAVAWIMRRRTRADRPAPSTA